MPRVAMTSKPIVRSCCAGSKCQRSLSASLTEMKTVPAKRQLEAGADLALGEGAAEILVEPHHLAGRAHLGAQNGVDAGEAREGQHCLLDRDVLVLARA